MVARCEREEGEKGEVTGGEGRRGNVARVWRYKNLIITIITIKGRGLSILGRYFRSKNHGTFFGDVKYKGVGKFCKYRHLSPKRYDIGR